MKNCAVSNSSFPISSSPHFELGIDSKPNFKKRLCVNQGITLQIPPLSRNSPKTRGWYWNLTKSHKRGWLRWTQICHHEGERFWNFEFGFVKCTVWRYHFNDDRSILLNLNIGGMVSPEVWVFALNGSHTSLWVYAYCFRILPTLIRALKMLWLNHQHSWTS